MYQHLVRDRTREKENDNPGVMPVNRNAQAEEDFTFFRLHHKRTNPLPNQMAIKLLAIAKV